MRGAVGRQKSSLKALAGFKTRLIVSGLVALAAISLGVAPLVGSTPARADTLQMSSDNSSTGWYPNEPALSPSNVSGGDFGQLFDTQLNGQVYAQPLVVQPIVLTVTENDYVYGLNSTTGAIEWQDNFGPSANPLNTIGCGDVGSQLGITGTPVIDPSTKVAYFVAANANAQSGATEWFMHAVNVLTGTTATGWTAMGVPIQGHSDGDPLTVFNGNYETNRPGLVLVNGVVYATFGSQCDFGNWEGWIVGVSEDTPQTSPQITTMWSTEEDVTVSGQYPLGAGIWQSGSAPVVDSNGDIFVATGNGDIPSGPEAGTDASNTTYGEAVIELHTPPGDPTGQLQVQDWFIPSNAALMNSIDGDLGSGGPVALPSSMGLPLEQNVLLEVGKEGRLYVLNMNSLGGYKQGSGGSDGVDEVDLNGGVWSKPAVWPGDGGYIYVPTGGTANYETNGGSLDVLQRVVNSGVVSFQLVGQTVNSGNTFGFGTGQPIVTSNGTTSGSAVVWIIHANNGSGANSQLEAFNPVPVNPGSSGTLEELWQSGTFTSNVFSSPGVDNGIVYVGTKDDTLLAFGALPSATPALTGSNPSFATTVVSQSTSATATFTASAPTTVTSLEIAGSAFTLGNSPPSLPISLSTGQSITVPINFTPTALGDNRGQLTANFTGATATISLDGQGETSTASLSISPAQVTFAPVLIASSTVSQTVTITNISSSPITWTGLSLPVLPFTATNLPSTPLTLAPYGQAGDSWPITVSFNPPGSSGDFVHVFNSVFTLDATVSGQAKAFGVGITGTAAPPAQISIAPTSLDFGDVDLGSSATMTFDLGDQGGFPLTITSSTPPTGDFSALSNPWNAVIAADTSIVESVQFAPTSLGPETSSWQIKGDDGNGVLTLTLTGTGVAAPPPPPASSPPTTTTTTPITTTTPTLKITIHSGRVGSPLILATSGDPDGGSLSYSVHNGTASGCAIEGGMLSAKSEGTCIVTATKAASGSAPIVSSTATAVTFTAKPSVTPPLTITINFTSKGSTLNGADKIALSALAKKLTTGEKVTCVGYAEDNAPLALTRAKVVALYLTSRLKVDVTLKEVVTLTANSVVATAA